MSQAGLLKVTGGSLPPSVATSYVTNSGTAVPVAHILNILGSTAVAGTSPLVTTGSGNTVTVIAQRSQAIAAADSTKIGLSAFDSSSFSVDANGFVTLIGGSAAIEKVNVQTGTSPIVPSSGAITFNGAVVSAGTNPVRTDGTGANTMALEVQISQAVAISDATTIGLANFKSTDFTVDGNGFVSLVLPTFRWHDVTTATQTISVDNGYVTDRGGGVTYTLPATANFGDEFRITGKLGLWTLAQNAGQQVTFSSSSTTVGVSGSLAATNLGDSIWAVCTTAGGSTIWRVYNSVGNITVT